MKRKHWLLLGVLLIAALSVPYFSASFVKQALQNTLETALARKVRIQGKTRFRVLPMPAIVAEDVTISEDPSFSLEPFAYVTELHVYPSFAALLGGRLEATRLRLTEPSVNLMRSDAGWNVQSLLSAKMSPPEIEVRSGRLNFKQGNSKSPFYLTNALVDISAISPRGDVKVFFSAEPARTDRGPQGFGAFSLRGAVHAPPGGTPDVDFAVELDPSSIHAFNFFFGARGVDFAGKLSGTGRIHGRWDQAAIEGGLKFEGLEPQGFLPFTGKENRLNFSGQLDIPGQRVGLDTVGGELVRVRMRARDFFNAPKGAMLVELRQVEFTKLLELGREANAKLPDGVSGEGKFNGVIGYSWPSHEAVPAKGMIWFSDSRMHMPDLPELEIPAARAVVEGSNWILAPAEIRVGTSQSAVMGAEWNARTGALKIDVATQQLSVKGLTSGLGLMLQASSLPLLSRAEGGSWQGRLQYQRNEDLDAGRWSGRLSVRNISVGLDGIPKPLTVSTANIQFDPNRIAIHRMRAEWESLELEGDVSYSSESNRPVDLNLTISEANAAELAHIWQTAQRPPAGLLEKMRLRRSSMPEWLRSRNVAGKLNFKALHFGTGIFEPLTVGFQWKAEKIEATIQAGHFEIPSQPGSVEVSGRLSTELWQPNVQYRWEGELTGWPTDQGSAKLDGLASFQSLDADWLDSAEGEATMSTLEGAKLNLKAGKLTAEYTDARRKAQAVPAPYWPLTVPAEP